MLGKLDTAAFPCTVEAPAKIPCSPLSKAPESLSMLGPTTMKPRWLSLDTQAVITDRLTQNPSFRWPIDMQLETVLALPRKKPKLSLSVAVQ